MFDRVSKDAFERVCAQAQEATTEHTTRTPELPA